MTDHPTPSTNADELFKILIEYAVAVAKADMATRSLFRADKNLFEQRVMEALGKAETAINVHYLPKDKVRATIGEDETDDKMPHWCTARNNLRHELRRALGLEEE